VFSTLKFSEVDLRRAVETLDGWELYTIPAGELSIALLDGATVAVLHGKFLGDPSPTDVITFPGDPTQEFAGEICISVDDAAQSAKSRNISLGEEIMLYLVHGWLHLAGLQDDTAEAKGIMRQAERKLLQRLAPLPTFFLEDSAE
jgi:probable rRNA maturation factor